MTFDVIVPDSLWAVRYDNCLDNAFFQVFNQLTDPMWLRDFFFKNKNDLNAYFKVTNVDSAIYETIGDAHALQCLILDLAVESELDKVFRPLEPSRVADILFGKEKAKGKAAKHPSWLRIYALKAGESTYIVTGGAIKLTATMQEREHTLEELKKMELVRNYLLSEGVVDTAGLIDFLQTD